MASTLVGVSAACKIDTIGERSATKHQLKGTTLHPQFTPRPVTHPALDLDPADRLAHLTSKPEKLRQPRLHIGLARNFIGQFR